VPRYSARDRRGRRLYVNVDEYLPSSPTQTAIGASIVYDTTIKILDSGDITLLGKISKWVLGVLYNNKAD
jgi:hypothetical protein